MSQFEPAPNQGAQQFNRRAWNELARRGQRFTRAATDADFRDPLKLLDSQGWLGPTLNGKRVLCLAAGGGRHGPLYAATGAQVTVVDVSSAQLELDREVAQERRLHLQTVETSMDDLSMFANEQFDLVVHPVSTCYLPDLRPVYAEVARVTVRGGLYVSQHKQPVSLQAEVAPQQHGGYSLTQPYYQSGPLPGVQGSLHREEGTLEFLHRWEQLIGWMCRAGFVVEDLTEPVHAKTDATPGSFGHRSCFVAPYVRIKARRLATNLIDPTDQSDAPKISRIRPI
ncbi:MAG: class I SAM-dependent methyltransferase [Planctomycetales bacterium]|nr:class I SAM-dependent methyltransferase [Planctomycetales bacterium]